MTPGPLVVVPYVEAMLNPATRRAVTTCGAEWNLVQLDPTDPTGYGRLLCRLWDEGRTFVLVEHDMNPTPGQLSAVLGCHHDWCGYRYWCGDQLVWASFGVVRFSADLLARHPTLAAQAAIRAGDPRRPIPWANLAESMTLKLITVGAMWAAHPGVVEHLHGRGAYGPS